MTLMDGIIRLWGFYFQALCHYLCMPGETAALWVDPPRRDRPATLLADDAPGNNGGAQAALSRLLGMAPHPTTDSVTTKG